MEQSVRRQAPTASAAGSWSSRVWLAILATLTIATLLLQGYHPLAEDGGLYVAGIQYTLQPTLFPHYTVFVTEHLRFSVFAPVLASVVRITHLSLEWVLLLTYLLSIWLTFYAARKILQRTIPRDLVRLASLCLLAAFWSLPIAGTSLLLMDPYVTARSLSTPLSMLAVAFALDFAPSRRPVLLSALCLVIAAAFHPLMAAYAFAFVIVLRLSRLRRRYVAWAILTFAALALAFVLHTFAPAETPAIIAAEKSRYYWFLSQWQWFEILGLVGPLAVFVALLAYFRKQATTFRTTAATLCRASLAIGLIAILVALFFAHEGVRTHLVARLQPLRVFLLLYAVMTLLLGAVLTQLALEASRRLSTRTASAALASVPAITIVVLAATMFYVQRQTFPASEHLELPWRAEQNPNPWVRAFLWVRANTPADALFALDAKYVNEDGEDAQTFRATALRSAIPDFSKDGGEAAITLVLAEQWQQAAATQVNLSTESDAIRDARVRPFGVTWVVLHAAAQTTHPCPYNNGSIKVCHLTP